MVDKKTGREQRRVGRPITQLQKKFAREYLINSGNGTQAALKAYPNVQLSTAHHLGSILPKNPRVVNYMREILDEQGLTDSEVGIALRTILKAGLRPEALKKTGTRETLMAIRQINELKDNFPAERKIVDKRVLTVNAELADKSMPELTEMLAKLAEEAKHFSELLKKSEEEKARKEGLTPDYYEKLDEAKPQPFAES